MCSMREADGNNFPSTCLDLQGWFYWWSNGVADVRLCMRRVGGLRVADASVMPCGHTKMLVRMLSVIERLQISPVGSERDSSERCQRD